MQLYFVYTTGTPYLFIACECINVRPLYDKNVVVYKIYITSFSIIFRLMGHHWFGPQYGVSEQVNNGVVMLYGANYNVTILFASLFTLRDSSSVLNHFEVCPISYRFSFVPTRPPFRNITRIPRFLRVKAVNYEGYLP